MIVYRTDEIVYTSFDLGKSWWTLDKGGVIFQSFQRPPLNAEELHDYASCPNGEGA